MVLGRAYQPPQRWPMDLARHHLETIWQEKTTRETSQTVERRPEQILERNDMTEDSTRQGHLETTCWGLRPTTGHNGCLMMMIIILDSVQVYYLASSEHTINIMYSSVLSLRGALANYWQHFGFGSYVRYDGSDLLEFGYSLYVLTTYLYTIVIAVDVVGHSFCLFGADLHAVSNWCLARRLSRCTGYCSQPWMSSEHYCPCNILCSVLTYHVFPWSTWIICTEWHPCLIHVSTLIVECAILVLLFSGCFRRLRLAFLYIRFDFDLFIMYLISVITFLYIYLPSVSPLVYLCTLLFSHLSIYEVTHVVFVRRCLLRLSLAVPVTAVFIVLMLLLLLSFAFTISSFFRSSQLNVVSCARCSSEMPRS